MKISTASDPVIERTGIASDGAFRINFNAKMARILSDGIYSNKPEAICRELGCNALDSHIMAGKGHLPIEIHMPTELEPFFHVCDFGLGLDHDEVANIFTVYGESTKTDTNDAVGQLGLGSKVPFAYCDAFDVVARKNGVERHYSMYKNETGLPSCALLFETPTDQCNGVTVKMAVPRRDFTEFADSARNVFRWFDVLPVFTGISNINMPKIQYDFQGTNWGVRGGGSRGYGYTAQSFALMGPVAYPIDIRNVKQARSPLTEIMRLPLVLKFEIGELDMAVSREALSYDERTQQAILDRLLLVQQELSAQIGNRIRSAATLWDAHVAWEETFGTGDYRYEFSQIFGQAGILWKDKLIRGREIKIPSSDLYGDSADIHSTFRIMRLHSGYKKMREERFYSDFTLPANNRTVIVFNDLDKGAGSRILKLSENSSENINVFCFPASQTKSWAEMEAAMGGAPVIMASSLAKRESQRIKTAMLRYMPAHNGKNNGQNAWRSETIDLEEGGYYVRLNRWDVMDLDNDNVRDLGEILELSNTLGIKFDSGIYAARNAGMKATMKDNADWINVLDHLREKVTAQLTPHVLRLIASRNDYTEVRKMFYDESMWKNTFKVHTDSPWNKFIEAARKLQQDARIGTQLESWSQLAKLLGMDVENIQYSSGVPDMARALDSLYPMAHHITSRWINNESVIKLTEYVNSMDELRMLRNKAQTVSSAIEQACT